MRRWAIAGLLLALFAQGAMAQPDSSNVTMLSRFAPDNYIAGQFQVREHYAYLQNSTRLYILDLGNLTSPTVIGETLLPGIEVYRNVQVFGDYAYLTHNDNGLQIMNIADPSSITSAGSLFLNQYGAGQIVATDAKLFIDWGGDVWEVHVGDPDNPQRGYVHDLQNCQDVYFENGMLFALDLERLVVLDLADPDTMTAVGTLDFTDADAVNVEGFVAYVAKSYEDTWSVDISDPMNPDTLASFGSSAYDVDVWGDYAVLGTYSGAKVYNVSDPANPVQVGHYYYSYGHSGRYVQLVQNIAYVNTDFGLVVLDITEAMNVSGVEEPQVAGVPRGFRLGPAWPNPFNAATRITLHVNRTGQVRLDVFNMLGRRVGTLHDGVLAAGAHDLTLDAARWPSGSYVVRASTEAGDVAARRITLVR